MADGGRTGLGGRLGLNFPYGWWPRPAALKAIEAAGFEWVQVESPPVEMLAEPRHAGRHGQSLRRALEVTSLRTVVHGPESLRLGISLHDRAFEGLLEYACGVGASQVVYHALDFPEPGPETAAEERALERLAPAAEERGLVIALENLCPSYPGPPRVSHDPAAVRELVLRCGSPAVGMLLDVAHAHIVADGQGADLRVIVEAVLDVVCLFHVHDNLGVRREDREDLVFDPLRLDLHLSPGEGLLPWDRVAPGLVEHAAPLVVEVHPSQRPGASALYELTEAALLQRAPALSSI